MQNPQQQQNESTEEQKSVCKNLDDEFSQLEHSASDVPLNLTQTSSTTNTSLALLPVS